MRTDDTTDRFDFERQLLGDGIIQIAGVDEAGRGPLAGPVVAAAVVFPAELIRRGLPPELGGLNDSKQLTAARRDRFFEVLTCHVPVGFSIRQVEAETIDAINIVRATHRAMAEAVAGLGCVPQHVLVDGLPVRSLGVPHTALVGGDARSFSIAAASVLAKVTRDRLMIEYDRHYPGYGFARHKGYGTAEHLEALARLGPCPIHRRSFAPLKPAQRELF
jgi:ribonuclease HII